VEDKVQLGRSCLDVESHSAVRPIKTLLVTCDAKQANARMKYSGCNYIHASSWRNGSRWPPPPSLRVRSDIEKRSLGSAIDGNVPCYVTSRASSYLIPSVFGRVWKSRLPVSLHGESLRSHGRLHATIRIVSVE
jgi:hypothetical protein